MKESEARQQHSKEPLTPGNVFAHMIVAVILLGGVWGIEWLKSRFEHGVPTLAAASIATGELAMFTYFVGALVRACKWAFSEFDEALVSIRNTHLFKDTKRALVGLAPLLIEAIPSPGQLLRASRFVILFVGLAIGALLMFMLLNIFTVSRSGNMNRFSTFNTNASNHNSNSNTAFNSNLATNTRTVNSNTSSNANVNSWTNSNDNANSYNASSPTKTVFYRSEDRGPLSIALLVLLSIFNHSGAVAIVASILVALTILTFFAVQIIRAFAGQ